MKYGRPRMDTARRAADVVLNISSATNGKLSQKSYEDLEEQTGMQLKDISSERAAEKITFLNITSQPREVIPTAVFPGSNKMANVTHHLRRTWKDSYHSEH